jgi:hypothetical protein
MGGPGSGRWERWSKKDLVEECRQLDIHHWHREGWLRPLQTFRWSWWHPDDRTTPTATIGVQVLHDAVQLDYTLTRTREAVSYRVPLAWTPCHYGGQRPWFRCPGVVHGRVCHRRVAKHYLGGRYFLCRHCNDLRYGSQREPPHSRAWARAQRIRRRLGGSGSLIERFPSKRKGMHWRTYRRLQEAERAADTESDLHFFAWLARADARLDRILAKGGRPSVPDEETRS